MVCSHARALNKPRAQPSYGRFYGVVHEKGHGTRHFAMACAMGHPWDNHTTGSSMHDAMEDVHGVVHVLTLGSSMNDITASSKAGVHGAVHGRHHGFVHEQCHGVVDGGCPWRRPWTMPWVRFRTMPWVCPRTMSWRVSMEPSMNNTMGSSMNDAMASSMAGVHEAVHGRGHGFVHR